MPLNKIPGVGKVTFEKLKAQQLICGRDVKASNEIRLMNQFGKLGKLLWHRCHGIDEREIVTFRLRKSVGVERTFPTDINDLSILKEILFEKLLPELKSRSAKHLLTRSIQKIGIKVKFNDFHQTTKEFTFNHFDESLFSELLVEALERGQGKKVRLLGAHIDLSTDSNQAEQYSFSW